MRFIISRHLLRRRHALLKIAIVFLIVLLLGLSTSDYNVLLPEDILRQIFLNIKCSQLHHTRLLL